MTTNQKDLDELIKAARDSAAQSEGGNTAVGSAPKAPTGNAPIANTGTSPQKPEGLAKIRTFEHDAKTAIEDTNASLARIKLADDKRERIANNPKSTSKVFWVILAVLILVGGGVTGYLLLTEKSTEQPTVFIDDKPEALISYDSYLDIDISNINMQNDALGTTYIRVFENDTPASLTSVSKETFIALPNILTRNTTDYMYGLHNGTSFLITKTPYQFALPGMLAWEAVHSSGIFSDGFLEDGIIRGTGNVYYAIKNGYVVIARDEQTVRNITNSLF